MPASSINSPVASGAPSLPITRNPLRPAGPDAARDEPDPGIGNRRGIRANHGRARPGADQIDAIHQRDGAQEFARRDLNRVAGLRRAEGARDGMRVGRVHDYGQVRGRDFGGSHARENPDGENSEQRPGEQP